MSRIILKDALPLSTPLVVQIFPIYHCNFSCSYCHMSIPRERRGFVTTRDRMPLALFEKCMADMKEFPEKTRVLRFVGMGEPLLHGNIADMVYVAKRADVADTVEILTNGSLLTKEMTDNLADAGLDRLVVALQGLNPEMYRWTSGVDIDWDKFVGQIEYAHGKGAFHVHAKIMDIACPDTGKFSRLFSSITNSTSVEHAGPIYAGVDANARHRLSSLTQYGDKRMEFQVCPQPFAAMQINPDGNVVPCYSIEIPVVVGNAQLESVYDIWHGEKMRAFRLRMLNGMHQASENCSVCKIVRHRMHAEDYLDDAVDRLKGVYA